MAPIGSDCQRIHGPPGRRPVGIPRLGQIRSSGTGPWKTALFHLHPLPPASHILSAILSDQCSGRNVTGSTWFQSARVHAGRRLRDSGCGELVSSAESHPASHAVSYYGVFDQPLSCSLCVYSDSDSDSLSLSLFDSHSCLNAASTVCIEVNNLAT